MKLFYYLLLGGLLSCFATSLSAQPLGLIVSDDDGAVGEQVCVNLIGTNFNNIAGIQFTVSFDPAVLAFVSGTGNIGGVNMSFINQAANPGNIRAVWSPFFATSFTNAGPFTFGTICFNVLQEVETTVSITSNSIPIEITNDNEMIVSNFTVSNGTVNGGTGGMPTCSDGIRNGNETGVDCGGSCPPCTPTPTCTDGIRNGNETGIDCGGSCPPCTPTPTCTDGIRNGNETGIDCGGSCPPCTTTPTCSDGIQNGTETGIDCGGSCAPCATTGGPDTNCGMGTNNFSLCLGDACGIAQGGQACIDITVGKFTNITSFQTDINFPAGRVSLASFTSNPALADPLLVNMRNSGQVRVIYFQADQNGVTFPDGTVIGTVCFTNNGGTAATVLDLADITASNTTGQVPNPIANDGSVNGCGGTPQPTCSDGIQNGTETGVDCGGSCAPCATTGGPDTNCGMGTNNFSLCLGDACGIPAGGQACIDITVGKFTNVTSFQFDINYPAGSLALSSHTFDAGLVDAPLVNMRSSGQVRVIYLQMSQTGVSYPDGTVLGTICFTNNTAGTKILDLADISGTTTTGIIANPVANDGSVNGCTTAPTCSDGIMNGTETGIDCGGSCPPCTTTPTCFDGIMNGTETGIDCGGSCTPCNTGGGGPDTNCGMGTSNFSLCLGDACNIAQGANVCLDITAGNFNGVTAFQTDITFPSGRLFYQSITTSPVLVDPIQVNVVNAGTVRLLYFQNDQSGATVANGDVIATVCFTNQMAGITNLSLGNITASASGGQVPNPIGNGGSINDCTVQPTCNDGIQNNGETGIDCGGPNCAPCQSTACGSSPTDVEICVGSECAAAGAEVCVPVYISNFDALGGLQFSLNYAPANLQFTRVIPNAALVEGTSPGNPSDGRLNVIWNDPNLTGVTLAADAIAFELCFTVEVAAATPLTFFNPATTLRAFDDQGTRVPATGGPGAVNVNCTTPTCTDGIMNGDETGIDCGGSCAPCNTGGGPDTSCGMGTNNFSLCLGDACGIAQGAQACIDLTVGKFTNITAFQADVEFPAGSVSLVSSSSDPGLGDPLLVNMPNSGRVRIIYFQQSQTGVTYPDGSVIGTLCFTNNSAGTTNLTVTNITANSTTGQLPNPIGNPGMINGCTVTETCTDGIRNNGETGVDCGGPNCAPCAASPLGLDVGDGTASVGQQVCVEVDVANFTNLTNLALTLNFDPAVLQLASVTANSALPGFGAGNFNTGTAGQVRVTYTSATPRTLANGQALFTVCWTVLTGSETTVSITNATATNGQGTNLTVNTSNGTINAGGVVTYDNLTLVSGDADGAVNDEVCVDVRAFNFENAASMQFAITYDASKLEFVSATSTGALAGLQGFSPTPGVVRVIWFDPNVEANSVPDGNSILSLCFRVLEVCETPVEIVSLPGFTAQVSTPENQPIVPFDRVAGTINEGENCGGVPDNLVLDLGSADGAVGEEVCIGIVVTDFTSITNLSFSITYDATAVTFARVANFGLPSITAANVTNPTAGVLTFNWTAPGTAGRTLADGQRLLNVCFTVDRLVATNVNFANSPTLVQARNASGQNVGVIPIGGSINPNAPVIDGLTFQIGSAQASVGDTVCLPVIGYEAIDLVSFQYTINYDPAVLAYVGRQASFAFNGNLLVNSSQPGVLRIIWSDDNAMGNTLPDGGALYDLCFRVLASTATTVSFGNTPTAIEFETLTGIVSSDLLNGQVNGGSAPAIVDANVIAPFCAGGNTGSISLTVSGGPSLTYRWLPNVSTTATASNLAAGVYSVTVTNGSTGQTTTGSYTLVDPTPLSLQVGPVSGVTCNGEEDGSITLQISGGQAPYTIDWSGNLPDNVLAQNNLDGGSYSVTITDDNDCVVSQTNIMVSEPASLQVGGTPVDIRDGSGGVNLVVTGGRNPYTYAWTGPGGYTSTVEDPANITTPGTYCVTVTDNAMCTRSQCFAVIEALAVVSFTVDPGCFGEDNGSIDITVRGGTGNYNYQWSQGGSPLPQTTQDLNNLSPGDYTVTVTSGMNTVVSTITVDAPAQLRARGTVTAATMGNNGAITLTPTGGNAPYTFQWDDGPTTQNRTGLAPGEYCLTMTDESDCTRNVCYTVGAAAIAFVATSTRPASCVDEADGVIRLVIANGVGPFVVRVEPVGLEVTSDTSTIEISVAPGTYEVTVTDEQDGMLMVSLTVGAPSAIVPSSTVVSDTEDTNCSGMVSLSLAGGTGPYTVRWNNGQMGQTITQLCAGAYVATITDANGCTTLTDTLRVGRIDEVLEGISDVSCQDGTDGSINVSISGGVEPYTFAWRRAGEMTVLATTEDLLSSEQLSVGAGAYTLSISDATGATLVRNYTVGVTSGFQVTASVVSDYNGFGVSCPDATDGRIVPVISGQSSYTFEYILGGQIIGIDSVLENAAAGTYTLTVLDDGGCEIVRTLTVTAPPALVLTPTITNISCGETRDGVLSVAVSGGAGGNTFRWSTGATTPRIQNLGAGDYGLTVTDANGCTETASYSLTEPADLALTFVATDATDGCNGAIQVLPLGGSGEYRFNWPQLPGVGNSALAANLCPGEYTIEVSDGSGCQTVTMVATVLDRRFPCLSTREVISPNGDGLNETLVIFCSGDETAANNNLEIFNRWGQLVYEVADYDCSEDGGLQCFEGRTNDGVLLPAGPYYYVFEFSNPLGERMQQRGSFTIVRD
ncbi:cohesin domain-containing protein [Neolewinella lacunae]|uniref:Gliding motility-associated C-terminal domain-containing protein n=1 Tax=Neolewinella lacunae TaxID=1517758 RepID=A0A923PQG4_9BACT|nr:cohesin domain-containing protein [Neolewinella lacunae]MBC6995599.1 gliding motility-associated C-terminal domain-containing protein [Neolewinella lacunae]MDN3635635.1 cohesin domain-containing protein [Neolewinella lacunae]